MVDDLLSIDDYHHWNAIYSLILVQCKKKCVINSDFISHTHTCVHSHNLDDSCKCNNMTNIHQQTKHWFFVVVVQCSVNKISLMYCKIMMIYDYFLFTKIVYVLCFACIFNQWSSMNRSIFDWIDQRMNEKKNNN